VRGIEEGRGGERGRGGRPRRCRNIEKNEKMKTYLQTTEEMETHKKQDRIRVKTVHKRKNGRKDLFGFCER
jgi:hypothetical protein